MVEIYSTPVESAVVSPNGWARLPSGIWVTKVPLVDETHLPLFARLDLDGGRIAARRYDARLISPKTVVELNRVGFRIKPKILPDAEQRRMLPRLPGETSDHYEIRIRQQMSSLAWCERHDWDCWSQLAAGWDYELPTMNIGKWWVYLADLDLDHDGENDEEDWSHLFGWSKTPTASSLASNAFNEWYQPLYVHAHKGRHQKDYGTLTMLESDTEPMPDTRRKAA